MSRKYCVRHETTYRYAADVMHSHHLLHLVPRPAPYQECLEHELQIEPASHRRVDGVDAFGNPLIRLELAQPHRELRVISQMQIEVHARPAVSPETTAPWEKVRDSFAYRGAWPSRDELDAARFPPSPPQLPLSKT
jgi:transglutaminase-like putative cysteine protease